MPTWLQRWGENIAFFVLFIVILVMSIVISALSNINAACEGRVEKLLVQVKRSVSA